MNIFLIQLPSPYLVVGRIQERFVQIKSIQTPIKPVMCPLTCTPFSYPCRSNVKQKKKNKFHWPIAWHESFRLHGYSSRFRGRGGGVINHTTFVRYNVCHFICGLGGFCKKHVSKSAKIKLRRKEELSKYIRRHKTIKYLTQSIYLSLSFIFLCYNLGPPVRKV